MAVMKSVQIMSESEKSSEIKRLLHQILRARLLSGFFYGRGRADHSLSIQLLFGRN